MIACPVCEHQQAQGLECDVCGMRISRGGPAEAAATSPMDDLEPTRHAAAEPGGERMAAIEPTLHAPAGDAPGQALEIEATRAAPVDVQTLPVPGLEPSSTAMTAEARTALPVFVACRYCRATAVPGERFCARCGMRLPLFVPAVRGDAAPAVRICPCGAPLRSSGACPSCGTRSR